MLTSPLTIPREPAPTLGLSAPMSAAPALASLVNTYGPRLLSLARRICPNRSDAEDLVQETFLQAHRKLRTFQGRSDPGTWLYTIAVRICGRKFRGRRSGAAPSYNALVPLSERGVADLPGADQSPIDVLVGREALEAVHEQIAAMPGRFRLPLVLKDVCDLSVAQAAEVLGIKPETLKTRVHRARLMVRRALVAQLPQRPAPAASYDRQVCLDLLGAKLDAMDRGRGFPIGQEVICERCRAVFAELDLTQAVCARIAEGHFPASLRAAIMKDWARGDLGLPHSCGNQEGTSGLKRGSKVNARTARTCQPLQSHSSAFRRLTPRHSAAGSAPAMRF